MQPRQSLDSGLARTVGRIAAILAAIVPLVLPLGYFTISYQYHRGMVDAQAEINARLASQVINANPEMWQFMRERLEEFLSRRPRELYSEIRRIINNDKQLVAQSADIVGWPTLTGSAEIRDSGLVVGRIEIVRSLRPLLVRTAGVFLLALLLGWLTFAAVKIYPMRALHRALAENSRLFRELEQNVEELQQKSSDLERANKAKDEFLSVMSHELRTPLNAVIGYSGMLKDGILGEINSQQVQALDQVLDRARDQLKLINSILQATQIGAGKVKLIRRDVDLAEFFSELKSRYEFPIKKDVTLQWQRSGELPILSTDEDKLKHILQNLIDNALKFTEKGRIVVSVQSIGETGAVQFKVTDTGVGISAEMLPVVFEKFQQADGTENRSFEGVGLGLHIVKTFTELLGGKVDVESEEGRGSTFTVTLPARSAREENRLSTGALAGLEPCGPNVQ